MNKISGIVFLFSIMLIACLTSCNIINPDEKIPSYIKVDTVGFSVIGGQGSAKQKIKDIWAYMDGQLIGVFQLPALIPVIGDEGNHSFLFAPGIYDNGIASTHIIYRLMKGPTMDFSIVNGAIASPPSIPVVTYFPGVTFSWIEDFENSSGTQTSGDALVLDNADSYEGANSGKIVLNSSKNSFRFDMRTSGSASGAVFILPTAVTYLEMNYKCDYPFLVGLTGVRTSGNVEASVIYINPSETWNKIYINLGSAVRTLDPSTGYKLYFGSTLGGDATSATFRFDNLKLVHD